MFGGKGGCCDEICVGWGLLIHFDDLCVMGVRGDVVMTYVLGRDCVFSFVLVCFRYLSILVCVFETQTHQNKC